VRTKEGFEKREVVVGRGDDVRVEIVFGLDPGEVIAVSKTFVLKAELGKGEAGHDHAH
jgi:membrane fusion protein, heavy metal efflux system